MSWISDLVPQAPGGNITLTLPVTRFSRPSHLTQSQQSAQAHLQNGDQQGESREGGTRVQVRLEWSESELRRRANAMKVPVR